MFLPACDVLHSKERPCRKLAGAYREVMRLWFSFSVSRSRPCGFLYKVWSFCSATFQFASEIDRAREWESVYLTGRAGSLPSCKKKKKLPKQTKSNYRNARLRFRKPFSRSNFVNSCVKVCTYCHFGTRVATPEDAERLRTFFFLVIQHQFRVRLILCWFLIILIIKAALNLFVCFSAWFRSQV